MAILKSSQGQLQTKSKKSSPNKDRIQKLILR
jgi:hypothetical protein